MSRVLVLNLNRKKLLDNLSNFSSSSNLSDLLLTFFEYCRYGHSTGQDIVDTMSPEEQSKLAKLLIQHLPLMRRKFPELLKNLRQETASDGRLARSAVQFLADDLSKLTSRIHTTGQESKLFMELLHFMENDALDELSDLLEKWMVQSPTFMKDPVVTDLRGVPESHDWWTSAERNESVKQFGEGYV